MKYSAGSIVRWTASPYTAIIDSQPLYEILHDDGPDYSGTERVQLVGYSTGKGVGYLKANCVLLTDIEVLEALLTGKQINRGITLEEVSLRKYL